MKRIACFLLIFSGLAVAQSPNVKLPFGPWTAAAHTVPFDNRQQGNFYFVLTYQAQNCTGLTLTFQSATGVTSAGTMGTYTGTVISGINPNTNTSGNTSTFQGFVSWYGVSVSGLSGAGCTISGSVLGFVTGAPIGGNPGTGCPGSLATPCVVDGVTPTGSAPTTSPVYTAGFDGTNVRPIRTDTIGRSIVQGGAASGAALAGNPFVQALSDGTNAQNALICPSSVVTSTSSSGELQLVALVGGQTVRICKLTVTAASPVDLQLTYGTGSACAVGTTNLWAQYKQAIAVSEDFAADNTWLAAAAGNAVCINSGGSVAISVSVSYAQF